MKKRVSVLVFLLCTAALSLTSCQVNWFDTHYDVPWWVIAAPVLMFSFVVWIAAGKHIASKKYMCPKCNKTFHPKWWKAAISLHINDDRFFKCPHCERKSFCHVSKERKD
ncbi:MAG: hypothetical protein E7574_05485 [Ruminococcaceae bacterium]|nr:hypothetical protein [Oscillospiraceae bacterium]